MTHAVCRNITRFIIIAVTLVLVVRTLSFSTIPIFRSFSQNPPISHDFGIGFDLNPSYGTVAVSYPNGSTMAIAKIEGDAAYREMMYRLSLTSSQHPHKPYENVGDGFQDIPRHTRREIRKSMGRPASTDVGTLSEMIVRLKAEAETFVREPITAASISIPRLAALYYEDIADTFEYLSLNNVVFFPFETQPIHATNAVYAGHGRGFCDDYRNVTACNHEESFMPLVYILAISYTNNSLTASQARFGAASRVEESPAITNLSLGYSSRPDGSDDIYWEQVRDVISAAILTSTAERNVTKVMVWGEAARQPKFREVLDEVVDNVLAYRDPETIAGNSVFSGAEGAAEFAKRAIYAQRTEQDQRADL